jgi:hypothetical protein
MKRPRRDSFALAGCEILQGFMVTGGYTNEYQDGYNQSFAPSVHPLSNPLTNTTASWHEICREAIIN